MFRKLLFGSVASLAALSPLTIPANAAAHEFRHGHCYYRAYRIYYHDPCRPGWICGGTFRDYPAAVRCGERFRCRGFEISIRG
jgi:hypothetical protein